MNFLVVITASIAVLVVMHGITFAIGRRIGRYNVVDVTWVWVSSAWPASAVCSGPVIFSVGSCC
jgi:steroid 5-alpha reductase family enzyme